jgi:hypothetical protein
MTIKQLGGVFGRNPTFNDVTIEGELTFDGDIDINSNLKVSGELEVIGNINSTGRMRAAGGSDQGTQLNMWTTVGGDGSLAAYQLVFNTGPNDARVEGARFTPSGNLAFVSGKGIDFSATAGTGTSELLDDYEEGDWTPAFANIGTGTYTHQVGRYTKVGNLVTASVHISINVLGTASGSVDITNLPFTASNVSNNYGSASSIHAQNFTTAAEGLNVLINPNTAVANVYSGAGTTSAAVSVTHAVMGTGNLLCTLVYFTA